MTNPSVFLSYSHDSEVHKAWVRKLAEDLRAQGVDATLDQWDLRPGADVVAFMEAGIRGAERVLMVCSGNYVRKAEERKGGAGYEGTIVTSHVARSTDTVKFIPLVRDNPAEPLVPDFLGPRLWLDFRDDALYAERLEELVRELHAVPRFRKPPLGRPSFLVSPAEVVTQPQAVEVKPSAAPPEADEQAISTFPLQRFATYTCLLRQEGGRWRVEPRPLHLEGYREELAEGVALTMLKIPTGKFLMGSPTEEPERLDDEGPQHEVMLGAFFLGQTPITQAQWRVVALWQPREGEEWGRELKADPRYQGNKARLLKEESDTDNRPVEWVNWHDAMEFCSRLSQRLGRTYTLPSEAQWEYACRAGTSTPFHFGATLTPELANYAGNTPYKEGHTEEWRQQTTPVGSFPANAWGLHDMHGNVWEWCLDYWQESYEGAPSDGSAWLNPNAADVERRLLRGGSWRSYTRYCRSAARVHRESGVSSDGGLRVACLI